MRIAAALAAALAAGCAAGPAEMAAVADAYAARFVGQPVNRAIAALGPPALRRIEAGGETLLWEFGDARDIRTPIYEQRAGLTVIAGYRSEARLESCLYEIAADAAGIVLSQRLEGSPGPCRARLAD